MDDVLRMIEKRKEDHLKLCMREDVEADISPGFDDVHLIHNALPETDMDDVDTSCRMFGKKMNAPIVIEAITGGAKIAHKVNVNLARAAEECGIAMGVGSVRAAIENKRLWYTYQVRDVAPSIPLISNLGIVQFSNGYGLEEMVEAVERMDADAIALHLNPLQEVVQPEGDRKWRNALSVVEDIIKHVSFPIIAKETGAGISREVAVRIEKSGFSMIDVGGAGGTSFAYVEHLRQRENDLGVVFKNWGIPTAISVVECVLSTNLPVIASGGVRSGTDGGKAIALGANYFGGARPFLKAAMESHEEVKKIIERWIKELKMLMFLVGAKNIEELKKKNVIITGFVKEWLEARSVNIRSFATREQE